MSVTSTAARREEARRGLCAKMVARDPNESHRAATPLELFFDLVFVVAIAQAASGLHHAIAEGHTGDGLVGYAMVFFAIWWAWMNFTWFASAYDCDDVLYRLAVFVQISGALMLAAGVPTMFETRTANAAVLGGYVVMRLAIVAQWLRASKDDPKRRATARRYAHGIAVTQVAWVALVLWGLWSIPGFLCLAACELAVPVWAERAGATPWHPHHIAERYGLMTIIVLGESVLAASVAIESAIASGEALSVLAPLIVGGLLIVYSMWWLYFHRPVHDLLTDSRKAFVWGYGHFLVFMAAAAVGAGIAVGVDAATHHSEISSAAAGAAVAVPAALYLLSLQFLHDRPEYGKARILAPIAAGLVLLVPLTPLAGYAVLATGVILALLVCWKLFLMAGAAE
ncbi:MAG TPA: low temperature requirement protein A [Vicinamibacteria bacterium]|nr:low temperature requirement protein A [Vicinamibacteria bacterium]